MSAEQTPFDDDDARSSRHPVDVHVGKRIRERRSVLGIPQEKLADNAGVTFQQVQKYESGKNRVSASRLFKFAQFLDVPVNYFFDGLDNRSPVGASDQGQDSFDGQKNDNIMGNLLHDRDVMELVRTFYSLKDPKLRKELLKFLKQMAETLSSSDHAA